MVMNPIVFRAEKKIIQAGILLLIIAFLLGLAMVWWFNRSIQALIHYAKAVPNQANLPTPKVSSAELTVLANALGEMRSKLDGKAYVEDYVHSLTHELKSPLAAIKGSAELLQEDLPIAYRQQFANSITTQSLRMQEMIERMLFLVKLERAPQLNLVSCDMQALVAAQIQALQQPSSHLQWQLALSPCTLNIDVFWVEQALQNIIHNAISFSPDNGVIAVKSWQKNGYYTIEITDEGAGIPDFALNKIFDRFYSLSRPNGTKSSGIGLNLVQHIMQLHQGQVHVSNRIRQQGVQVRLLFPLI
jgi:two-component system sensor histidine kinase CreC